MLPEKYKSKFLDAVFNMLWKQWTALGVAGHSSANAKYVLDPEALLLFSLEMGRYDQRLFDEILDWLYVNAMFLNVQRLRSLSAKMPHVNSKVIGAVSAYLAKADSSAKWKKIATDLIPENSKVAEPLFFLPNGKKLPVVGDADPVFLQYGLKRNPYKRTMNSTSFPKDSVASLLLQLRAFFGVNARAETMLCLLASQNCRIQDVADISGFSWRSVQDTLFELGHSSVVSFTPSKKSRVYYLNERDRMKAVMMPYNPEQNICFPNWTEYYSAILLLWSVFENQAMEGLSEIALNSELIRIRDSVTEKLANSKIGDINIPEKLTVENTVSIVSAI